MIWNSTLQTGKQRSKKCAVCKSPFVKQRMGQVVCGPVCAGRLVETDRLKKHEKEAKADRKATKARLIELKPLKWWRAKLKRSMHAYVRARDEGKPCISCDTVLLKLGRVGGDYDAGHFRSVGSAKHLEFDERNVHGQCKRCNDYLGGNYAAYEVGLRARYGDELVDALKADNEPRHYKVADLLELDAYYTRKLKELKAGA